MIGLTKLEPLNFRFHLCFRSRRLSVQTPTHHRSFIVAVACSQTSGMICNLPSGVYSVDHDRQRVAQKQINLDVTMIVAVAGRHLYFVSNAVKSTKKEEPSP